MVLTLIIGIGATAAVMMVWRTKTTAPVAPTVPQIKPRAEEAAIPGGTPACRLTFTVAAVPELKCDSVKIDPTDTNIESGTKRTLTMSGSGGQGSYIYSWTLTSDGTNKGTLSSTTGQTVTWTAPSNLSNKSQTWTIVGSLSDGKNVTTSDSCKVALSYTYNPSCNSTCTSSSDCPGDLACSGGRCRNSSCINQSDCKCPAPLKLCNDTCTVKEECASGMTCAGGNCRNVSCINEPSCVCQPAAVVCNSACTSSADCPSNLACTSGRCRNPSCTTATNCVCFVVSPPTPPVQSHKACRNQACVAVTGAGVDTCTSDVSCRPVAVAPPKPQPGMALPTVVLTVVGVGLLFVGLLAL